MLGQDNRKADGIVVFSGYNPRGVIAFLRTLQQLDIKDFIIIARDERDELFMTAYRDDIFYIRKNKELCKEEFKLIAAKINDEKRWDCFIIAPSTEFLNRYMLRNRVLLREMGYIVPLVEERLYEQISDKESFGMMCSSRGFDVPKTFSFPDSFIDPFVAKPITYEVAKTEKIYSPVLVETEKAYGDFIASHTLEDFYFQEMISGESYYLLYYFSEKGSVYRFSQQNLMQQADGKSITAAYASSIHKHRIADEYEKLFRDVGFRGLVMVEIRLKDGKYYMIEANPRFWGPSQLFVDAGFNLFFAMLSDWGFAERGPDSRHIDEKTRYCWYGGLKEDERKGKEPVCYSGFVREEICGECWIENDVYNRKDTMKIWKKTQ